MKFLAALLFGTILFLTPARADSGAATPAKPLTISYSKGDGSYWAPVIVFDRPFSEDNTEAFNKTFSEIEEQGPDYIIIEVDSYGGDVDAGWKMKRIVERSHTKTICVADNKADSMAVYFMQSCTQRMMTKRSSLLVHYGYWTTIENHSEKDFESFWHRQLALNDQCLAQLHRFKVSRSYIKRKLDAGDWILLPDEALKAGAVDKIIVSIEDLQNYLESQGKLPK